MKNIGIKLAAVAFLIGAAGSPALAGKGGGAANIRDAIQTTSVDAIIAEVERAESLICSECVQLVVGLTDHNNYRVREVAAWWIAKRPGLKNQLAGQFKSELVSGVSVRVRNAADFLGASSTFDSLPQMRLAIQRTDINADAKIALVKAAMRFANPGGNGVLLTAMADADATVRMNGVKAWREIRDNHKNVGPAIALLTDSDAMVRAEAATVVGGLRGTAGVAKLEQLVVSDASQLVRKNAAWALGKIGSQSSRTVLAVASNDPSQYVRMTARAALASIR